MTPLQTFRAQHPEYQDVPDQQLIPAIHDKFYADVPFEDFALKMGLGPRVDPSKGGDPAGVVKAAGSGAVKGLIAGTLGFPGDASNMVGQAGSAITGDPSYAQSAATGPVGSHGTQFFLDQLKARDLELHKPQGSAEHYADATAAGATSLVAGKAKTLPLRMLTGAMGGAGGEAGSELMTQNPEEDSPVARIVSSMIAQFIPGMAAMRKPQAVKALKKDLKDLPESELRAASERAQTAQDTLGTDVTLPQGFMDPTALSGVQREVARSGSGDILRKILTKQTAVGQEHIDNIVAGLSKQPIDTRTENRVAAAGAKAIQRTEDVRSNLTKPSYEAAARETVPLELAPNEVQGTQAPRNGTSYTGTTSIDLAQVIDNLRQRREDLHITGTPAGDAMGKYMDRLQGMADRYPNGVPVLNLDALAKQARDAAQAAGKEGATPSAVQKSLGHSAVSQVLNEATTAASQNLKQGKDLHARASETIVDPMLNGPMGEMFPPGMRQSGKGNWSSFSKVLEDPGMGPRDITFVAENLRRADPAAFPAIVKQNWLAKAEAARAPVEGRAPQAGLGEWATSVAGAPGSVERDKFRETIKQVALSNGKDPAGAADAVRGAEAVIDALHTVSRDRGGLGQINPEELRRASGANIVSSAMRTANVMAPFQTMGRAIERVVQQKTYTRIAEALSSPQGIDDLLRIARFSQPKEIALQTVRGIVGMSAQHQSAVAQ